MIIAVLSHILCSAFTRTLALAVFYLLISSSVGIRADTDVTTITYDLSGTSITEDVNFPRFTPPHIARNFIVGDSIPVCGDDYPLATQDAIDTLNGQFASIKVPENDIGVEWEVFTFATTCPSTSNDSGYAYVSIEGFAPSDPRFRCSSTAFACVTRTPNTHGGPLSTYNGVHRIFVNADARDPDDDMAATDNVEYMAIRRTIAHELGHLLGLADYDCSDPGVVPIQSLMQCTGKFLIQSPPEVPVYPFHDRDTEHLEAIYRPNAVINFDVSVSSASPESIEVEFDARNVFTEDSIDLRRWDDRVGEWVLVNEFDETSGEETWTGAGQPSGRQVYRLFVKTFALARGQCFENDGDCSATSDPSAKRIGFASNEIEVVVPRRIIIVTPPVTYTAVDMTVGLNYINWPGSATRIDIAIDSIDEIDRAYWYDASVMAWYAYFKNGPPFLNTLFVLQTGMSYQFWATEEFEWRIRNARARSQATGTDESTDEGDVSSGWVATVTCETGISPITLGAAPTKNKAQQNAEWLIADVRGCNGDGAFVLEDVD